MVLLGSPVDDLVLLHLKTLADWSVSIIQLLSFYIHVCNTPYMGIINYYNGNHFNATLGETQMNMHL